MTPPTDNFTLRFLGLTVRKILGGVMQPRRIYLDATQEYTKATWRDNKNTYHTRYT